MQLSISEATIEIHLIITAGENLSLNGFVYNVLQIDKQLGQDTYLSDLKLEFELSFGLVPFNPPFCCPKHPASNFGKEMFKGSIKGV